MKSLIIKLSIVLFGATLYIASPFATAWLIRESVRTGNSDFLAYAVEWPSVRETLRPAITRIALGLPESQAQDTADLSIWQRLKAYWGKGAVDRMVDAYVTPEGLPQLFTARKAYRDYVSGDDANPPPLFERIRRTWARVQRAEFTGLATFEIDMEDKFDPGRVYLGKLELTPVGWKLKELRVKFLTTATNAIQKLGDLPTGAL